MKIEELKQLADRPIGDLPHNNWTVLFQMLGEAGVKIRDIVPLLQDEDRRDELISCLRGRGFHHSEEEKEMARLMGGWNNFLSAPLVSDALGLLPAGTIGTIDCGLNWAQLKWMGLVVYSAALSLRELFERKRFRLIRFTDKGSAAIRTPPNQDVWWWNEKAAEGYSAVGLFYNILDTSKPSTLINGWEATNRRLAVEGLARISLPNLVQNLILRQEIQGHDVLPRRLWCPLVVNVPSFQAFVCIDDASVCLMTFEGEGLAQVDVRIGSGLRQVREVSTLALTRKA